MNKFADVQLVVKVMSRLNTKKYNSLSFLEKDFFSF